MGEWVELIRVVRQKFLKRPDVVRRERESGGRARVVTDKGQQWLTDNIV